jgi:hypothetical protein
MQKLVQSLVVTAAAAKTHVSAWDESHFSLVLKAKDTQIFFFFFFQ